MNAYYEMQSDSVLHNGIKSFKNTVSSPRLMAKAHWHNSYEILYVRRGFGEQQLNSKKFPFSVGSVIVICPRDVHATIGASDDGCEIDVLQFPEESLGQSARLIADMRSAIFEDKDREIGELFEKMYQLTSVGHCEDNLIMLGSLFTLLGIILDKCKFSQLTVKKTEFANQVCEYLISADDVRIKSVSKYFGYSCEHFSRKFHAEAGISYKEYSEGIRMQKFIKLFDSGELSLGEIAELLGYSDKSSAIRSFKRVYGITPGAYKKIKNTQDKRNLFA